MSTYVLSETKTNDTGICEATEESPYVDRLLASTCQESYLLLFIYRPIKLTEIRQARSVSAWLQDAIQVAGDVKKFPRKDIIGQHGFSDITFTIA